MTRSNSRLQQGPAPKLFTLHSTHCTDSTPSLHNGLNTQVLLGSNNLYPFNTGPSPFHQGPFCTTPTDLYTHLLYSKRREGERNATFYVYLLCYNAAAAPEAA